MMRRLALPRPRIRRRSLTRIVVGLLGLLIVGAASAALAYIRGDQ